MENKNLMLLEELIKLAKYIFTNHVTLNIEGKFTAAELSKGKDSLGRELNVSYNGHDNDMHDINFDWCGYSLPTWKVFEMLYEMEKICNIRGEKKTSFVFGKADNEVIKEKAMYYTGSFERGSYNHETGCHEVIGKGDYKVVVKKTSLKKLSDNVAEDKKGRMFYKSGDVWYMINERPLPENITDRIKNEPHYIFGLLEKFDFSFQCELNAIFVALFDAMKSERINNTPDERKSENEPENTVICDFERVNTSAKEFNKHEALKETEKRMREKHPNYIALIRYNGMYYSYGESAKAVRYVDGVLNIITDPGDYICFPESLLDAILPKLIKAGRGVLTCDIIEDVPEDYPPEPYNESDTGSMERPYDEPSCKEIENELPICDYAGKSANSWGNGCLMLPGYFRQKVFPTESFQSRRKIRRFKPRYFVGYTNYHLWEENALERKRNGNTSVYRVLIRGKT